MGPKKILLAVLGGVAAGTVLGILFAPDSGSNTKKKISKKSGEYIEELEEKFNEFIDGIKNKIDKMKEAPIVENGKPGMKEAEAIVTPPK